MKALNQSKLSNYKVSLYLSLFLVITGIIMLFIATNVRPLSFIILLIGGLLFGISLKNKSRWDTGRIDFKTLVDSNNIVLRIMLHFIFWLSYLMIYTILVKLNVPQEPFWEVANHTMIYFLPIDMAASYFTVYFLMPRYLYKGKYIKFILSFILSAIGFVLLTRIVNHYIYIPRYMPQYAGLKGFWEFGYFYYIVSTYAIVIFMAAIKLTKRGDEISDV